MRTIILLFLLIKFSTGIIDVNHEPNTENSDTTETQKKADDFFRRFWNWRMRTNPQLASSLGLANTRLNDMSLASYKRREQELRAHALELKTIKTETMHSGSTELKLNIELLLNDINQHVSGFKFMPYVWPLNNMEGPQLSFPRLISKMARNTVQDFLDILMRMRQIPRQIDQMIELMREGIRRRLTMNKISFESAGKIFAEISRKKFNESLFAAPFLVKPKTMSAWRWKGIVILAELRIEHNVNPAYKRLSDFVLGEYKEQSRKKIGVSSLPNGKEYYEACLRFHTTTNLTASEVHQIGLGEVSRITHLMEKIRQKVGFNGSLSEFSRYLRSSKEFGFKDGQHILDFYKRLKIKVSGKLGMLFARLPKYKYVIKPVPMEVAPSYPIGYYNNVSPDGKTPGVFYANTYMPATRRRYVATSLFLHEAVPGHHLQTSLTYEYGSKLSFRKYVGVDERYYQVPALFAMNSAYLEGWGLYSEYLGEELGLYNDPYDLYGRLSSEMLRACRLVIDTGIHLYGWTRESAVQYLNENTAEDELDIQSEVDRYITWPGQACSYKIGEIKIKELRTRAQHKLGVKFDVRRFHDFIVTMGAVPLGVLEEQIDDFIQSERERNDSILIHVKK